MSTLLWPLAWIFATVVQLRRLFYDWGWLSCKSANRPVISIGNLSSGGTGKTPITIWLAQELKAKGLKVGAISRGYRAQMERSGAVVDLNLQKAPLLFGDEPTLLAKTAGIPVAIGKDKWTATEKLVQSHPEVQMILADDAFQHRRLHRQIDVVLLDMTENDARSRLIPVGRWREPLASLRRADFIFLTKFNWAPPERSESWYQRCLELGVARDRILRFKFDLAERSDWKTLAKEKIAVLCAIARPESFVKSLESKGLTISQIMSFRDHHTWSPSELTQIEERCRDQGISKILVTEKDLTRLNGWTPSGATIVAVGLDVTPMDATNDFFAKALALAR